LNGVFQKQKIGHLMEHYMIPHHVSHIFSLETAITFEPIIRSNWNLNLICILWYESLKKIFQPILKLSSGNRQGRTDGVTDTRLQNFSEAIP
jgi:hypothetical protein